MKFLKFISTLSLLLILVSCSSRKNFNFSKEWTWEDLAQFTEDKDTQKYIKTLQKNLTLDEAYFLFRELEKIDDPNDIFQLADLEKKQKQAGGQFYGFIPDYFQNKNVIPPLENFDYIVANAYYISSIRTAVNRYLYKSAIYYNLKFGGQYLEEVNRQKSTLDLDINLNSIKEILHLYNTKKIPQIKLLEIAESPVFSRMIACRSKDEKFQPPLPMAENISTFIELSAKSDPIHRLWNWMNPANNFGFAELYQNRDNYKHLIDHIEANEQLFEDRILARLEKFIPDNFQFKRNIDFGVNFGQMIWSTDEVIGVNIVHIKDDFNSYTTAIRKELFDQIHEQLCRETGTLKPDFKNNNNDEYYKIISYIYFNGLSNYISGAPLNFDYIPRAKDSNGILEQLQRNIYIRPNPDLVKSMKGMAMQENGMFTGLGYLMARTIERKAGTETLALCVQNGPVYFFKTYLDLQSAKKTKKYFNFDKTIEKKINELYNIHQHKFVQ